MPEEKPAKDPKEILVFSILRNAKCAECGGELSSGSFLTFENNQPHCLACADLDHLAFLGRGDVCVTRRAKKYSALSAVVLRFSRARSRYERQGILVEEPALDRAEEECEKDADKRAAKRAKAELQRVVEDKEFTAQMAEELRRLFHVRRSRRSARSLRTLRSAVADASDEPRAPSRSMKGNSRQP
jgi:hypothetical protein